MPLLHVTVQSFRQCKWPRITSLNPAEEGTFVGGHVLPHGFYYLKNLGTRRAGQLFHSWRGAMFGLKMCHKSLLSGVPFCTLLTPVPPLFTTTFLVEIIHGPRSQYFSTLVTRPPGIPSVGLHMALKGSCALKALAAQFTTGFPCLYLRHFERNIFSCGSRGTHLPPSQYIFQDALGPLQILLGNLYEALLDLRTRFSRSWWS